MTIRRRKAACGESARDFCRAATIGDIITSLHLNCAVQAPRVCRPLRQSRFPPQRSEFGSAKGGVGNHV